MNLDPIGFFGGDINLYRYVLNNPVKSIDEQGLWGWVGSGIGFVSGVIGGVTTGWYNNGLTGAIVGGIVGGVVGGVVGFVAPSFSSTAATVVTSMVVGGLSNTFGQILGNKLHNKPAFDNFSIIQVIASALAGPINLILGPVVGVSLYSTIPAILLEGSLQGLMTSVFQMTGYFIEDVLLYDKCGKQVSRYNRKPYFPSFYEA